MKMTAEPGAARLLNRWCARALAAGSLMCLGLPVLAQNAIQSINSTQQGSADVVRIEMAQPLAAVPKGFSIQSPPRVAIDLPGVTNAMGKSLVDINLGNLRSVNVAQGDDRTRLVLNLKQAATYRAEIQGKTLLLTVESGGGVGIGAAPSAVATTSAVRPAAGGGAAPFAESLNTTSVA